MGEKKRRQAAGDLRGGIDARAGIVRALELLHSGRPQEARAACEPLYDLPLRDPEALHYLGYLAIELGAPDRAVGILREAVRQSPSNPHFHNTLAIALQRQGLLEPAVESFERAIALAPDVHEPFHNLGNALWGLGRYAEAAACYRRAAHLAPQIGAYRSAFAGAVAQVNGAPDPDLRPDLIEALVHEEVDPKTLMRAAVALLRGAPDFAEIEQRAAQGELTLERVRRARGTLEDPLLLRALEQGVIGDPRLERLLTRVRRVLLEAEVGGESPVVSLELICALAHQAFATEYAWSVSPAEQALLATLRDKAFAAAGATEARERALALLAAYAPLHLEPRFAEILDARAPLQTVLRRQVLEPREEAQLRQSMASLDAIDDDVSRAVQAQYETHPYPRWTRLGRFDHARPLGAVLKELFPHKRVAVPAGRTQILIAGCGTGSHSVRTALRFENTSIVAIDLSRTSLAHALRKTRELGIGNVEYVQGDLLRIGRLARKFDLIECLGVLHHLRDPIEGWRSLLGLLADDGIMRIGLYSELGRAHIVRGQAFANERGHPSTDDGIRALRQDLLDAAEHDAALAKVAQIRDFYSLSGTRDLLLHVQEHRYTLPKVAAALRDLGLELLGFELPGPHVARAYLSRFPSDPAMDDLASWDAYERAEPDTFSGMYQFWVRRSPK